jgi:serine/threonine protein kinase
VTTDAKEELTGRTAEPKGRYRIVSDLGVGAFGNVCVAEDEATGHEVAIRFLPRGLAGAPHASKTRQRAGGSIVAASAAHPALVRVLELGDAENGHGFVAMELVQGRRLSEVLSEGPLEVATALRMAIDLGGAVETLHNLGLVHGALRPRNVMVREDGGVKLMDVELIGLREAWKMKGIIVEESPPEYLSPEQIRGLPATEATDVYAFAAILYEMLAGTPPFQAKTREAVLAKHLTETPTPMRRRRRTVPGSLESVVALALSKPPNLRPSIQNLLNHLWEEANGPASRWKRKAAIVGGAVLAASIALVVGLGLLAPRPSAPPSLARPVPPAAAEHVPVSAPAPSSAFTTEARMASPLEVATPAVVPPVVARPAPPSPLPPSAPPRKVERREQPLRAQAPAGLPREQAAASNKEASEFDAAIDWLLERSAARKQ